MEECINTWVRIAQGSHWQTGSPRKPEMACYSLRPVQVGVRGPSWMQVPLRGEIWSFTPLGLPSPLLFGKQPLLAACVFEKWAGGDNSGQVSIISLQMNRFALDCHGVSLQGESWAQPGLLGTAVPGEPCRKGSGKPAFGLWSWCPKLGVSLQASAEGPLKLPS